MRCILTTWIWMIGAFLTLTASPQNTDFSQKLKPVTVKVLLMNQASDVTLEVKGRHYVFNPFDGTQVSWGIVNKRHPIKADDSGIHWGEKFPGHHQLRFVPGDSQSSILVNGIQYRGCVEVYLLADGKFNIINEVDVENYLKSTLSHDFQTSYPDEVMSGVAIIARTSAYFFARHHQHAFWHVEASQVGYQGASAPIPPHVERAVNATYHAVLTYQNSPFAATWTHNSAGKTADFAAVFRKALSTPAGVQAPIALKDRHLHKWSHALSKTELSEMTGLAEITAVDLYLVPESGKVYAIKVSGGADSKNYDFAAFQKLIGQSALMSNDFEVVVKADRVDFTGHGKGPGVGLCLYSAKVLAEQGKKAPQILETFFPETKLEKR